MEVAWFQTLMIPELSTHLLFLNIPVSQFGSARTRLQGKVTQLRTAEAAGGGELVLRGLCSRGENEGCGSL